MTTATSPSTRRTATAGRRPLAAAAAALLAGLGVAAAAPAGSSSATGSAASSAVLADRRGPWSAYANPVVQSQPASGAQSTGVVLIDTVLPYQQAQAAGTGMVLTSGGQVLTNYHVVAGASTITVTVAATHQAYQASVVGSDATDDVALLQLTGASGMATVVTDSDGATVGEQVTAIGNAGGTGTLTAAPGSVSSLTASVTPAAEGAAASESLSSMIETTADVVPGDSGGPLVDAQGEVVGIDTAASTGAEIDGYAIPIARALGIVDQIRAARGSATVRIGPAAFLGVQLGSVPSYDESGYEGGYGSGYGSDGGSALAPAAQAGAPVEAVLDGGPAAAAGLRSGSFITRIGDHAVSSAADVSAALAGSRPGDRVSLTWTDDTGTPRTATVTLGASPVA